MSKFPKVSVIIPAYNEEKCIGRALDAALAQNHPDFEVIVVDNNSTDRTRRIVEDYLADPRVRLVSESRQGLIFARQRGFENAKGEIIVQMDADCIPDPDWIKRKMKYFDDTKVAGVTGPYDYFDAPWHMRALFYLSQATIFNFMSWYLQKRRKGAILIGGNAFFRRQALESAGGYNLNLNFYAEDTDTAMRVSRSGRIVFKPGLSVKSSARRFREHGLKKTWGKYRKAFFSTIRGKQLDAEDTIELENPR
ncbi:MAG TPA: glycosyltransferase family 2 protein [Candidatus Paceibacterota bacterium]|nr:glycosyltransferase family 2 protein [Candidatus Paceibacterota bacterium]